MAQTVTRTQGMYHVAIIGEFLGAQRPARARAASTILTACRALGILTNNRSHSLGANASRLLRALVPESIEGLGFRLIGAGTFCQSAYLLAELPLGEFYQQRLAVPWSTFRLRVKAHLEEETAIL